MGALLSEQEKPADGAEGELPPERMVCGGLCR